MMYRLMTLLMLIQGAFSAWAQSGIVRGRLLDAADSIPLPHALVRMEDAGEHAVTNESGEFVFPSRSPSRRVKVDIHLTGYESKSIVLITDRDNTVYLSPARLFGPEVVVRPDVPEVVWSSDSLHAVDIALTGEDIWVLSCRSEKRWKSQVDASRTLYSHCALVRLDENGDEKGRLHLSEPCEKLYRNGWDEIYVLGQDRVWSVDPQNLFLRPKSFEAFREEVIPIVDSSGKNIYLSTRTDHYPAFDYAVHDLSDSSTRIIRHIVNEPVMEVFRSEFKYLSPRGKLEAFKYELKTGVEKEIVAAYMNGFPDSHYFEPMNAPMFLNGNSLWIFDHHHQKIIHLNREGVPIDSVAMNLPSIAGLQMNPGILMDEAEGKFYAYGEKGGWTELYEIDVKTGFYIHRGRLTYPYISSVFIRRGVCHYVWRPFESLQKRFLYRERVPQGGAAIDQSETQELVQGD